VLSKDAGSQNTKKLDRVGAWLRLSLLLTWEGRGMSVGVGKKGLVMDVRGGAKQGD